RPGRGWAPRRAPGRACPGQTRRVACGGVGRRPRGPDDLAVALAAVAGPDEIDGAGWQLRLAPPPQKRLRDFKVALMLDAAPEIPVDREVADRLQALGDFPGRQQGKADDRARPATGTRAA